MLAATSFETLAFGDFLNHQQTAKFMNVGMGNTVWTEKSFDLWQQYWQVDKKLQNQGKLTSAW